MAKRAQLDVMRAIRGLILGAIIVLTLSFVLFKGYGFLFAGKTSIGTRVSYVELSDAFAFVALTDESSAAVLDLEEGKIVVGFDALSPTVYDRCKLQRIERPAVCGFKPCLCLCDDDSYCGEFNDCVQLGGKYILAKDMVGGYGVQKAIDHEQGEELLLYGSCGYEQKKFGFQTLFVEKSKDTVVVSTDNT
jgi:hypothetical protein